SGDQTIDAPLVDKHGGKQSATTRVHALAPLLRVEPNATLLEITLETGRTHQIRLHLAERGHPIAMDDKHGDFKKNKAWSRAVRDAGGPKPKNLMLHAAHLTIDHPLRSERIRLSAQSPENWAAIVRAAGGEVDAIREVS